MCNRSPVFSLYGQGLFFREATCCNIVIHTVAAISGVRDTRKNKPMFGRWRACNGITRKLCSFCLWPSSRGRKELETAWIVYTCQWSSMIVLSQNNWNDSFLMMLSLRNPFFLASDYYCSCLVDVFLYPTFIFNFLVAFCFLWIMIEVFFCDDYSCDG